MSGSNSSPSNFDSELNELKLLRSEIENLQFELAERDRQISEYSAPAVTSEYDEDSEELQQLVEQFEARMKDMAAELEASEERIRTLNDLLQACEEANLAERDERVHMEKWLTEIESRLGDSDKGLKLEIEKLEKRCEKKDDLLSRAEGQIRKMLAEAAEAAKAAEERPAEPDDLTGQLFEQTVQDGRKVLELNAKLEQLHREVEDLESENSDLKQRAMAADADAEQVGKLQQKIALLEMEIARERAEISRERVELVAAQDELLVLKKESNHRNEADNRIRAMREHLREIDAKEKQRKSQEPERSGLGARISKLLGKV